MDTIVKVLTKHPEVTVDFLAVDINKSSCEKALELFAAVTREYGKRFNFNVVCCDILEIPVQEHWSFDMVTVVHTLYFVPSLENVLRKCCELKKSDGGGFTQVNVRNMGLVHKTVSVSKHYSSWVYITLKDLRFPIYTLNIKIIFGRSGCSQPHLCQCSNMYIFLGHRQCRSDVL